MAKMTNETNVGDRTNALTNEILRVTVGSRLHGLEVGDQDDRDEMGIFVDRPHNLIGLGQQQPHYVYRSQPQGVRSGPGDLDLTIYSLRKWMALAIGGNPSVLLPLYAPDEHVLIEHPLGRELRELKGAIVWRETLIAHERYMKNQWERMLGERAGHMPKRPELVEKYGFDTKYAGHAIRLGIQGVELGLDGYLTLPMDEAYRDLIVAVRTGEKTWAEVLEIIEDLHLQLVALVRDSDALPEKPDLELLTGWMQDAHLRHWGLRS